MNTEQPVLVISDLQIPFEHPKALPFCAFLKKHYKIPDENVLCVGDELDQYFGSSFNKDPDSLHTPNSELQESIDKLKKWYSYFPEMKLATSNHGLRWAKRASEASIPSQMLRRYQELILAPPRWQWRDSWVFTDFKRPFRMVHGVGYSGMNGHRTAAVDAGMSTIIGHLHSHAGISYIKTERSNIWGFNSGCLIDPEAYAFSYGKDSRFKPCLGAGVIAGGGSMPLWIPLE